MTRFRFAAWVALLFVVLALRRKGALVDPQFFSHDLVWFHDQAVYGWRAVGFFESGYWQLAARLIAAVTSLAPVTIAPLLYTVLSLALAAVCCGAFALPHFRPLLRSDALRAVLCLTAAGAVFSHELVGTPTNVQWYLLLAGVLLLACPPAGKGWSMVGFVLGASNALLVIGIPFVAVRWVRERRVPPPVVWGVAAALGVQIAASTGSNLDVLAILREAPRIVVSTAVLWTYRVAMTLVVGHRTVAGTLQDPPLAGLGIAVVALVGLAVLWRRVARAERPRILGAAYLATAGFLVPYLLRGRMVDLLATALPDREERYFFLPALATLYLVALAIEAAPPTKAWRQAVILLLIAAGGFAGNFRIPAWKTMSWRAEVAGVDAWMHAQAEGRPADPVAFAIEPRGWMFLLPGKDLPDGGFESSHLRWMFLGGTSRLASDVARSGRQSLYVTGDDNVSFSEVRVRPAQRYAVSVWARAACGETAARAFLWVSDAGGGSEISGTDRLPCDRWTEFRTEVVGSGTQIARVHVYCVGCRTGVYWDDASVTPVDHTAPTVASAPDVRQQPHDR